MPTSNLDLQTLLGRYLAADRVRVPPYPAIALKVQRIAGDDRAAMTELTKLIESDAALVATVLRRANVASAAAGGAITSLEGAVRRIGVEEVARVVLAQSVGVTATGGGPLASLRRMVWRQSLLAARIAAELAPRRGVVGDEAFVAALLHDFGAIAVLTGLEDLKVELPVLPAETWKKLVDRLHVEFGATIATRWKLPEPVVHTIRHHHEHERYHGPYRSLVELIATVDQIVDTFERSSTTSVTALLEIPGLTSDERAKVGAMVPELGEFIAAFEPETPAVQAVAAPTAIQALSVMEGWPFTAPVTTKHDTYEACTLTPDAIMFSGRAALTPNWLVTMTIGSEPPMEMLANVTSCVSDGRGGYLIVAQPFGLDGQGKRAWLALLQRVRGDAPPPRAAVVKFAARV